MSRVYVIYTADHSLDLSPFKGKLVDLEPGGRRGLRTALANFPLVILELQQSYPTAGKAAGIPEDVYDHFVMCGSLVDSIDEKLAIARKQVEVLEESRAFYIDAQQNDVAIMVDSMKSRAHRRKDPSLLAPFEITIAYQSQVGDKAAKTRKQNAAQAEQEAEQEAASDTEPTKDPAVQAALEAYKAELEAKFKAELEAKFNESLARAVEKKLAEMQRAPAVD